MADQNQPLDFSDIYKNQTQPQTQAPTSGPVSAGLNFSDLYKSPQASTPAAPAGNAVPASSPLNFGDLYGHSQLDKNVSSLTRDESDRFTQEDPGANWLEKSWDFLNKPLTETLFGWGQYRQGAGGFERGVEKVASNLFTPLSLLTIAAFAPAGIAEGVAGGVLKTGLTEGAEALGGEILTAPEAALKVENFAKAAQAVQKAEVTGQRISTAVESTGMPYQEFLNYQNYLNSQGLKYTDMLGESLARRTASKALANLGITPAKALAVAKGAETLVNTGFAVQQVSGAIFAYPRVLDLLQNGQYDDAAEYMVEAGAGTVFGTLGLAHSLHSVQDLLPGLNERASLPASDETQDIEKLFGHYDGKLAQANASIAENLRKHTLQMMDIAGVEPPANLLRGDWGQVSPMKEIATAWRNILGNEEARTKVSNTQKLMYFLLDNGGDRQLSHQESRALIYAYHLEDWAKDNLGEYLPPERTLEDIRKELDNPLAAKADVRDSAERLDALDQKISSLSEQLKTAPLEEQDQIKQGIKDSITERSALQLEHQRRLDVLEDVKSWANPTEEDWQAHYDNLLDELRRAAKGINPVAPDAMEEFNNKVRALGLNRQDLDIIEKEYPELRSAERDTLDKTRLPLDYNTPRGTLEPLENPSKELLDLRNKYQRAVERAAPESEGFVPQRKSAATKALRKLKDQFAKEFTDVTGGQHFQQFLENGTFPDVPGRFQPEGYIPHATSIEQLNPEIFGDLGDFDIAPDVLRQAKTGDNAVDGEIEQLASDVEKHGMSLQEALTKTPVSSKTIHVLEHAKFARYPNAPEGLLTNTESPNFERWFRNSVLKDAQGKPLVLYHGTRAEAPWTFEGPDKTVPEILRDVLPKDDSIPQTIHRQVEDVVKLMEKGMPYRQAMLEVASPRLAELLGGKLNTRTGANDFEVFDTLRGDLGTHLGNPDQSNRFVMQRGVDDEMPQTLGRILPVYARLENPLRLQDHGSFNGYSTLQDLVKKGIITTQEMDRQLKLSDTKKINKEIQTAIKKAGYDGVVYLNRHEGIGKAQYESPYPSSTDEDFKRRFPNASDSYIIFDPEQAKSVFNPGKFTESSLLAANKIFDKQETHPELLKVARRIQDINNHLDTLRKEPPNSSNQAIINSLQREQQELFRTFAKLSENDLGEVRQLPDGKKVAYISASMRSLLDTLTSQIAAPSGGITRGEMLPTQWVSYILNRIDRSGLSTGIKDNVREFVTKARNDDGSLVTVARRINGGFNERMAVLREELIHGWQQSLSGSLEDHLTKSQYAKMYSKIPAGMIEYLKRNHYNTTNKLSSVVEASAKMMAVRDVSTLGITTEEASDFLYDYFKEVEENHGEKAFDSLLHTTTTARLLKEKFLNELRQLEEPKSAPNGEQATPVVEGVQGEGTGGPERGTPEPAGGGSGQPPEPPQPPPLAPEDWWRHDFGKQFEQSPWLDGALHPALPSTIFDRVEKTRARTFDDKHLDYIKTVVKQLSDIASRELTDKEKALYQTLRDADDNNWTVGYNRGIIKSIVDNHIHHIWGEEEEPIGNGAIQAANSGSFSINASQAKKRSWATAFEGILQGRQLKVHDPAAIIAHDANNIARASANRGVLEALQNAGLKDVEGMPIAVFYGRGFEVPSPDGTKSSILVNPNIVRNILMQPEDVRRLISANLLNTYIKDGRVVDKTPQVHQGNVREWIRSTQEKIDKMTRQNPLLISNIERMRQHEAGWGQLQSFATQQASKIADYLDEAVRIIKRQGLVDGKNYSSLPPAQKPNDFNMAGSLDNLIHGGAGRKISPTDLDRIEEYRDRNRQYAQGYTSRKRGGEFTQEPILPYEIARLLRQEKEHLEGSDPELKQYVDSVHENLGTDWSRKGFNNAIYHIANAADNPLFKQLNKDLSDMKEVDRVYTSVNPITQQEHKAEAEKLLADINARQPKQYLWAPKTHIVIDHPSFHGYKWMATASDGTPTLAESNMGISRHYYRYFVNRLGLEPSWLRKPEGLGKITAPILKVGAGAKNILLSGSPFHVIQEVLRAAMLWVNPFVRPNPIENIDEQFPTPRGNRPLIRLGIENGLTAFQNRFAAEDMAVGVASHSSGEDSLARKIPGVSQYLRWSDQIHDMLFNRLIPMYKTEGFKRLFNKYAEAHPDWTDDAVAKAAAYHTNAAFGGINWRAMGRSAVTQDWFHLIALAPDWLESEMRFAASALNGLGIGPAKYEPDHGRNFSREQIAGMAVAMWTVARVLNQLHSGNPHYEAPFGLATKDKDGREIVYSLRTMPTDILHMATDPMGFLNGRMSPFLRTEEEIRTGRNQYGQKLTDAEKYVDLVSNLAPIWGQAYGKSVTGLSTASDVPGIAQAVKAGGGTATVYRTPAQKMAANLAAERSEEGSMTPVKIARHRLLLQLEDDMRTGRIKTSDLQEMVDKGNLPIADAKEVVKNVKETAGEDAETARMYSRVSRMDWQGALAVWDDANGSEKKVLEKLVEKKATAYIKKARTDFTPREQQSDPLLKRAQQIAPELEPQKQTVQMR